MNRLTIFTDPHLGTSRAAHTTRESSKALQDGLYSAAMKVVNEATNPVICVGDLFDKAFNPERILVQGYNVASRCKKTLAGNHDMSNREGTVTSLDALADMGVQICRTPNLTDPYFEADESIYMVPHHASQEVFEQAMKNAAAHAAEHRQGVASYLFLHCNYDFDLAVEDSTLNLTQDLAKDLISAFDYIFIGHEHNPSTHLGGQVVVLGNLRPTSFHDVSEKFIYHLELDTAELTKELVWSKDQAYREIKLGSEIPDLTGVQFVSVIGTEAVANAADVHQFIQDIWKASFYKPEGEDGMVSEMFAVRNKVEIRDSLMDTDTSIGEVKVADLRTKIAEDLKDTDLEPLFNELLKVVEA